MNYIVFAHNRPTISPSTSYKYDQNRLANAGRIVLFPEDTIDDLIQKLDLIDLWVERAKRKTTAVVLYLGEVDIHYKNLLDKVYPKLAICYSPPVPIKA